MNILVACEESGTVRDALIAAGHNAISCDLVPSRSPGPHIQRDALETAYAPEYRWDGMIAFPPCTDLASSGAAWFKQKRADGRQQKSIEFFLSLWLAPITMIAIENPVGIMSSLLRKPDQIIQPWQFGHGETKATCLWLKNIPKLIPTDIVEGREQRVWRMPPSKHRARDRSKTYAGIAKAMAAQWFTQNT